MTRRMCASCGERPAKHARRTRTRGEKMGTDRDHDLCSRCHDSLINSQRAKRLKRSERED